MRGQRDKVTFSPRGVAASFIIVMAALLFSCGLPTSEYLYPPAFESLVGVIRLTHKTENIDDAASAALFKGYDIYYRIFDSETEASKSYDELDSSLTSTTIATVAPAKGYYVLVKFGDTNVPLIPVSDNTYNYFDLNLNTNDGWTITTSTGTTLFHHVLRDKDDSSTADFYLSAQYSSTDQDYEGDGISSGNSVYIVFFAVAHGVSSSSIGTDIYSDPKILEPIAYTPGGS